MDGKARRVTVSYKFLKNQKKSRTPFFWNNIPLVNFLIKKIATKKRVQKIFKRLFQLLHTNNNFKTKQKMTIRIDDEIKTLQYLLLPVGSDHYKQYKNEYHKMNFQKSFIH